MCQLKNIFPNFIKSLVMKIKDLDKYTNAEKILLAEELWESVSKEKLALSDAMKQELDRRISLVEEDKTEFYTWEDVKNTLKKSRNA
jgi:putative addiction module component (TIGR02574 family)